MVLMVIIGSHAILRNVATEARSQREDEVIWRGNQYVRAIRAYYHKTGHYPQTEDDLLNGVGDVHFLRAEAIKDPLNKDDGSWRFIYTNAAGAIIGSVKYGSMAQMAAMDMNGGVMPGTTTATGTATTGQLSSTLGTGTGSTGPNSNGTASASTSGMFSNGFSLSTGLSNGQSAGTPPVGQGNGSGTVLGILGQPVTGATAVGPQPTGPVDGPVMGGMLVGVGSKVDATSLKVYKGGTKYNQWEFIWNPIEEQAQAIQQGLGGGQTGINGLGTTGTPTGTGTTGGFSLGGLTFGGTNSGTTGTTSTGATNGTGGTNTPSNPTQ